MKAKGKHGGRVTTANNGANFKAGSRHNRRRIEKIKSKLEAQGYTFPNDRQKH